MTARAATWDALAEVARAAPPPTAILTKEQVAAWLQIGVNTVDELGLPTIMLTERNLRYSVRQVLEYVEGQAERQ